MPHQLANILKIAFFMQKSICLLALQSEVGILGAFTIFRLMEVDYTITEIVKRPFLAFLTLLFLLIRHVKLSIQKNN